ncbi:MAG: hypothetical protein LBC64_04540 [Fibromonadaceae bacterium]|jgi:hypothetical protein|nr:hypothetical protein [Fibromonadaceae bacterium]
MFSIDIIQVAILWCIAGLTLVCAINSRGVVRAVVSGLITTAIVVTSVFFSYMKYDSVKREIGLGETPSVPSSSSETTTENRTNSCSPVEKHILEDVIAISDSILAFPKLKYINNQGIEKREIFESKALSLRNKSMDSYRQVRGLFGPGDEKSCYYDLLLAAADNLRLAGYETHSLFGQENDNVGDSLNKAAVYAAQAKAVFLQLREQL